MNIRFNRCEWAGAFGDIGTDLPLIVGMILAAGLDVTSVLVMYGLMQMLTGLFYQRPMPVQPLKVVAAIVIAQKIAAPTIMGAGISIAVVMALLTLTGSLSYLGQVVPKAVVRGIQLGLGMSLAILALKDYMGRDGLNGYILGAVTFILVLWLLPNKRFPAALAAIFLGIIYALIFKIHVKDFSAAVGFHWPSLQVPHGHDIISGFLLLALAQLPLSLGNSMLATFQLNKDLFPDKPVSMRKIGATYSVMNFISPLFGGVPVCHGSGGMMGHYTFGARTGGSLVIYGSLYLLLGLFVSGGFSKIIQIFPMPVLGVILFVESLALMTLTRDLKEKGDLWIAFMVGSMAVGLPYGFVVGLLAGSFCCWFEGKVMSS